MPARLETYVEELRHELRDLPVASRAQELVEVRTHLESLKAANVELGLSDEEAEAAAVAQFGGSQSVGKAVKKTHCRDQWDTVPGVAWTFGWLTWIPNLVMRKPGEGNIVIWPESGIAQMAAVGSFILVGVIIQRLFPRSGIRGSLLAIAAIFLGDLWYSLPEVSIDLYPPLFYAPKLTTLFATILTSVVSRKNRGMA